MKQIFYIFFSVIFLQGMLTQYTAQEVEPAPAETPSFETEGKDAAKKNNPDQNYIEMALSYINEKNFASARKYLQLAQGSGDEKIFQDAAVWNMYMDALEGKKNADSALATLPDAVVEKGLYYISNGWQTYFEKNPEAKDIYLLSQEYKEMLIARFPDSPYAARATSQLVPMYINEKNYEKALRYLLKYIDPATQNSQKNSEDMIWFYMGQILEYSREYRDLHKAIKAYQIVLKNKDSIYYNQARKHIADIEKFYHIIE